MRLDVSEVSFAYGQVLALNRVTLVVNKGERVCLLGANGSGKSTLARLLNGLLVPDQGTVMVGDWDTVDTPPSQVARRVAYLYQDPRRQIFLPTVADEVAFAPHNFGWAPELVEAAANEALELVELSDHKAEHPYELNDSELRRLALATVLSTRADFVILDEPTAACDRADLGRLLRALDFLARRGTGVVVITHDMEFAAEHFERALLLCDGRLEADLPPPDLFARDRGLPGIRLPVASRTALALGRSPGLATAGMLAAELGGVP